MKTKKKMQKNMEKKKHKFQNPAKSTPYERRISAERVSGQKEEKRRKRSKRVGIGFVVLQGMATLLFIGMMMTLGIFPFRYAVSFVAVVFIGFIITSFSQKRKKVCVILGRIWSAMVIVVLLMGSGCMGVLNHALESVTGAPYLAEQKSNTFDIMGAGQIFSITEDSFHIYVRDVKEDIDWNSISEVNLLATVNPETHQILVTAIPGEYYVTIPGVSNGQKDKLMQTGTFGVEASMAALGNLYETEISYYLKLDFAWIAEKKALLQSPVSWDMAKEVLDAVGSVSQHVRTNLSKYEVQQLIKRQIEKPISWKKTTVSAEGTLTSSYTYSMPDTATYVMTPDPASVQSVKEQMKRIEDGELLRKD